ncbi:hypothetical protein A6B39_02545 [Mannheimia granulomatis]|uniref:hypothetical protein n=1 Tax=Mannheimia granulomatis TaxID=85402 RepID=UPI00159E77F8|nr:hypothetical protein [Mannheimia granulomatis]QLB14407.1 hypothetical protein A6B39_02545 [Mannheimia granulomatis]
MKELTNSCCLHHVSGGWGWSGDPNCPGCNGQWEEEDRISRETVVRMGSWIGGAAGTAVSAATGAGLGVSILAGNGGADFGGFIAGTIYDNPESARHPDYDVPSSNLINPYK